MLGYDINVFSLDGRNLFICKSATRMKTAYIEDLVFASYHDSFSECPPRKYFRLLIATENSENNVEICLFKISKQNPNIEDQKFDYRATRFISAMSLYENLPAGRYHVPVLYENLNTP
jgi:hypothetical protein